MQELRTLAENENPDIIGVTETWANKDILNSELNISGCTSFRRDRTSDKRTRGGGVILYINPLAAARSLRKPHAIAAVFCDVSKC